MQSLQHSRFIKPLHLLDVAFLAAFLPVLLIVKFPMVVFVSFALFAAVKKKNPQILAAVLGFGALGFSSLVLGIENFGSLSWFVELIINFLLVGIVLQRLSQTINFYLVISPFLLTVLTLFFHNSIASLFFTVGQLFVFTTLFLLYYMQKTFLEGMRFAAVMFFVSLPVIVVLFLFFPRISYDRGNFGFKQDASAVSGHDGAMHLGAEALDVLSERKVMEVEFVNGIVGEEALYFRGSTLYEKQGDVWVESKEASFPKSLAKKENIVEYNVVLQPHYKHYVYALDYPIEPIKKSSLTSGYTILSEKSLVDETRYTLRSALDYTSLDTTKYDTLHYQTSQNKQTQALLQPLRNLSEKERFDALNALFAKNGLTYTLAPPKYDMQNFVDSFLIEQKSGYCVHFASAYATAARMLNIPSRVVTGYLGKYENRIENYLIIRQKDAHAWVELFLQNRGWVRIDPTTFAQKNLTPRSSDAQQRQNEITLQLNYIKYKIQTWILHYNYLTQRGFFKNLLSDNAYLLRFVGFIGGLIFLGGAVFVLLKNARCPDKIDCLMQKLLKKLAKKGIAWDKTHSLHKFLLKHDLKEIDALYIRLKFSKEVHKSDFLRLKKLIGEF
jgi:transglutaminase-like putative cysteine protease